MLRLSKPVSKLRVGLRCTTWVGLEAVVAWPITKIEIPIPLWTISLDISWDLPNWGPLLKLPFSNLNLPLSTLRTRESIKESGDSSICPLPYVPPRITSSLSAFNLSRLNIVIVAKLLSVSDEAVCVSLNSHVVIKGPSPSTQVHLRAEDFGGSHGGRMEKFEFI